MKFFFKHLPDGLNTRLAFPQSWLLYLEARFTLIMNMNKAKIAPIKDAINFLSYLDVYKVSDSHNFFLLLRENRTQYSILTGNFRELHKILKYHNHDETVNRWAADNSFRFKLQKQISRHLSNYLSSLFSIVEYNRKTIVTVLQTNSEVFSNFQQRKESFMAKSTKHTFIQDLRNFSYHNNFIKIGSQFNYKIDWEKPKVTVFVLKNDLLKWGSWRSSSKKFIHQCEDKIDLNEILYSHFEDFIEFQNWIFLQILLVDSYKTTQFIADIKAIYSRAKQYNQIHLLLFPKSYIRYIEYVVLRAHRTKNGLP